MCCLRRKNRLEVTWVVWEKVKKGSGYEYHTPTPAHAVGPNGAILCRSDKRPPKGAKPAGVDDVKCVKCRRRAEGRVDFESVNPGTMVAEPFVRRSKEDPKTVYKPRWTYKDWEDER